MQYTELGKRTGLRVSVLGFGAMRLPMEDGAVNRELAIPMIHRAFAAGVNYIDTAVGYCNQDSQRAVGEALQGWRERVVVSTKNHSYRKTDEAPFWKNLENSLARLRVGTIDLYHLHGLNWKTFSGDVDVKDGSYRWLLKARDQGLIRHLCFSFHDTPEALAKIAASGLFDVVTCQYNLLNPENAPAFPSIRKQGMGLVVMGPVGGGRLGAPSEELRRLVPGARSVPEVAMRFVLANPHVNVALSGMSTMEQVNENIRTCSRKTPLTAEEKRRVAATLKRYRKLADLYCTGCKYCMPCPSGVNIPGSFDNLNKFRVYGLRDLARKSYAQSPHPARLCIACGRCMPKCPQHIDIVRQLRDAVRSLDEGYGKLYARLRPGAVRDVTVSRGRLRARLAGALELVNLSDDAAAVALVAKPAAGIELSGLPDSVAVDAFGRASLPVDIRVAVPSGQALALNLGFAATREVVGPQASVQLAVAQAGRTRLGKSPRVPATARKPGESRQHALEVAAAWDATALYVRAVVRDDSLDAFRAGRPGSERDRVDLSIDLMGLALPRESEPPLLALPIRVELPAKGRPACRVHAPGVHWAGQHLKVTGRFAGQALVFDLIVPWNPLGCRTPRQGRVLGLSATLLSHTRTGVPHARLSWGEDAGWLALA